MCIRDSPKPGVRSRRRIRIIRLLSSGRRTWRSVCAALGSSTPRDTESEPTFPPTCGTARICVMGLYCICETFAAGVCGRTSLVAVVGGGRGVDPVVQREESGRVEAQRTQGRLECPRRADCGGRGAVAPVLYGAGLQELRARSGGAGANGVQLGGLLSHGVSGDRLPDEGLRGPNQ